MAFLSVTFHRLQIIIFNLNDSFSIVHCKKLLGCFPRVESGIPLLWRLSPLLAFQYDLLSEIRGYEFIDEKSGGQDQ